MSETWRAIPGFEGSYEASDLGRIRSIDRLVLCKDGRLFYSRGRVLRQGLMPDGHLNVGLGKKAGTKSVHILVLLAFKGERPSWLESRHLDGDPGNNRLSNLEYSTRSRNTQDRKWHNGSTTQKLTPAAVLDILGNLSVGVSGVYLAKKHGVHSSTIYGIKNRHDHWDCRL